MTKRRTSVVAAMDSPRLFGPHFAGNSWDTWRAVLRAAFAEPMTAEDIATFRTVAERDPPTRKVKELVCAVGRGGGKDSIASLIATCAAMTFDGKLRPGEKAVVMCLAVDRHQAGIVLGYIRGYFEAIPALAAMVTDTTNDSIELKNGVVIEVHTNSFRAVRGRSIICAIFDEVAFWRDADSANPDMEVHGAVVPGLARMPGSMLILISSVHKRAGLLYERWRDYYGKDDDDVLVVHGTTLQFNSTFDAKVIAKDIERDPALFRAEYEGIWRDDLSSFLPRDLIDAAIDRGVIVRPPSPTHRYIAAADPSGGRGDAFTFAIAHKERDGAAVLDLLYERSPPFNPAEVVPHIVELMSEYRISEVTGDKFAAGWVTAAFQKAGKRYIESERDRSAIYLDALPLFTAGRARLIDNQKMAAQFAALERRTFPTGRDRVDHPRGSHDDSANAAALALVLATSKVEMRIPRSLMARVRQLGAGAPVALDMYALAQLRSRR